MRSPLTLFAVIALSAPALVPAFQEGRDEIPYVIAVDVDLVVFNVTVTDRRGRHVPGLEADDFRIHEDGREQRGSLFNAEDAPANVGIIIDHSGSMARRRADVVEAALAFAGASHPDDEMFVVTFNERVLLELPASIPFTSDRNQIRSALLRTAPDGMTALYDALAASLEHLEGGTRDRKALVVLSDGADNASRLGLDEVLQRLRASSATIYTIGIYDENSDDRNPGVLRRLAESSGGRAYFPDSLQDLAQVWREIADGIRGQYTIGYHSDNPGHDGAFRRVRITARRDGGPTLRVTAREGYFAPMDE